MEFIELGRLGVFMLVSGLIIYHDLKSRLIPEYLFALGILLELSLSLLEGWKIFSSYALQAFLTYTLFLIAFAVWFRIRRKIPFGFGDVKYLTFVASWKGILAVYFSLFGGIVLLAVYCLPKLKKSAFSCRYIPFTPLLFVGALLTLIVERI
jgi:prepilin signal peptidase PulO-like enzyme (type II secretory pathway)